MTAEVQTAAPPRRLIPVEEAGAYLTPGTAHPLSRASIYRLIGAGKIQKVNIGKRSFVTAASIDEYVSRLIEGGVPNSGGAGA